MGGTIQGIALGFHSLLTARCQLPHAAGGRRRAAADTLFIVKDARMHCKYKRVRRLSDRQIESIDKNSHVDESK